MHQQAISRERLWRDVYRCVCQFFYYTGCAKPNPYLHLVYNGRIKTALEQFSVMFNDHHISIENDWTCNKI